MKNIKFGDTVYNVNNLSAGPFVVTAVSMDEYGHLYVHGPMEDSTPIRGCLYSECVLESELNSNDWRYSFR